MNHAVNAVSHVHAVVKRLKVNIGGAHVDHAADDGVHQTNHRRFTGQILQMLDKIASITIEAIHALAFDLVRRLRKRTLDVGLVTDERANLQTRHHVQGLEHKLVLRHGHRHIKATVFNAQRENAMADEEIG